MTIDYIWLGPMVIWGLVFIPMVLVYGILLSHPPAPIDLNFQYSRSISINMRINLMVSRIGPEVEVFQANIQIFWSPFGVDVIQFSALCSKRNSEDRALDAHNSRN